MKEIRGAIYKARRGPMRVAFRALRRLLGRIGQFQYGPRFHEPHIQDALLVALSGGDVFYDVGAHKGYLSLVAARKVGPTGKVYAFEPLRENVVWLKDLMRRNRIDCCEVIEKAVSDTSGFADLHTVGTSSTPSLVARHDSQVVRVSSITLDDFARGQRVPQLIKVDVEGAEKRVLRGATMLLHSHPAPCWIVEIHDQQSLGDVQDLLLAAAYEVRILRPRYRRSNDYPLHVQASKREGDLA